MPVDETIQVRCSRCRLRFRDKARRIREGYSRQCPSCERMMFFIEGSPNKDISDAMREAQRVRKLLTQEEQEKVAQPVASVTEPESESGEFARSPTRQIYRRVRTAHRAP